MTDFVPLDLPAQLVRLIRVDLDPAHPIEQRLDPDRWVEARGLAHVALFYDGLEYEELTPEDAAKFVRRTTGDARALGAKQSLTPLAIIKPPKPIGAMTDAERKAFVDRVYEAIAKARKPVA